MGVQSGERGQELLKPKRKRAPRGPAPAALLKKIDDELWDIAHMDIEETPPEPLVDPIHPLRKSPPHNSLPTASNSQKSRAGELVVWPSR